MKIIVTLLLLAAYLQSANAADAAPCPAFLDHEVRKLRSQERINLCQAFAGRPLLIVNTASHCGFTPQFKGLETLYQAYRDRGLAVIGVPSNDFRQAARDEEAAAQVCFVNYGVTFTMLSEQKVRGPDAHPVFRELGRKAGAPEWNFNKFLVDRAGNVLGRFGAGTEPMSPTLQRAVESTL